MHEQELTPLFSNHSNRNELEPMPVTIPGLFAWLGLSGADGLEALKHITAHVEMEVGTLSQGNYRIQ